MTDPNPTYFSNEPYEEPVEEYWDDYSDYNYTHDCHDPECKSQSVHDCHDTDCPGAPED